MDSVFKDRVYNGLILRKREERLILDAKWMKLYGISVLTGIDFTMSLFVNFLSYNDTKNYHYTDNIIILLSSLLLRIPGYPVLRTEKLSKNLEKGNK